VPSVIGENDESCHRSGVEGKIAVLLLGDKGTKLNILISLFPAGCKGERCAETCPSSGIRRRLARPRRGVSGRMERLKKKGQGETGIIQNPKG